jgi:hypothetical protein
MDAKKRLAKLIGWLRQSCANPRTQQLENIHKDIEKQLRSSHPRAAAVAAVHLKFLGCLHGSHGALAVLEGDTEGWREIDRMFNYQWWSFRIDQVMTQPSEAGIILAQAMVWEEDEKAAWVGEHQLQMLKNNASPLWDYAKFAVFALELWSRSRGRTELRVTSLQPEASKLGVYQEVLDHWEEESQLIEALRRACDYHLAQATKQTGYPEFDRLPFGVFPVDMLAVARVRQQSGLAMPKVDHPLLRTPLADLPSKETRPSMGPDTLLEKVIAKARSSGVL